MRNLQRLLNDGDWQHFFDSATLQRGRKYADEQRVTIESNDTRIIRASCRGSGNKYYTQQLLVDTDAYEVTALCSCPVGYDCKHCAAVLFHLSANLQPDNTGISNALRNWLEYVPELLQEPDSSKPEQSRLHYILTPEQNVAVLKVRLRKDGSIAEILPYNAFRDIPQRKPRFAQPLDLRIALLAYAGRSTYYQNNFFPLEGTAGGELLGLLLESGRLFLDGSDLQHPLRPSPTLQAQLRWEQDPDGSYYTSWKVDKVGNYELISNVHPLHYLDLDTGEVGPLQHGLPDRLARHLTEMPAVHPEEANLFGLSLRALLPELPLPTQPQERLIDDLPPTPCLRLGSKVQSVYLPGSGRMSQQYQHRAALSFDYAGKRMQGKSQAGERILLSRDGELLSIARQGEQEKALRKQLEKYGPRPAKRQSNALPIDAGEMYELNNDAAWLEFAQQGLPQLRELGWQIDINPGFQFDLTPVDGWYADIDEAPEHDWFDLELGILVEGQRISLLPVLLRLIQRNPELLSLDNLQQRGDDELLRVQLDAQHNKDKRPLQVALPFGRLKPVLATLGELYLRDQPASNALRLSAPDAARLSELEGLPLEWQGGERLRAFAQRLRDCQSTPVAAPEGLHAELRPYQLEGLSWMQTLRELEAGGVLGDDMGLGKTLQCLAHLLTEKRAGRLDRPALVVMPTSLIPNWQDEATRFTPDLRVLALHGPNRHQDFARLGEYDLLLTTYALLPRDLEQLSQQPLHVLILDEAQYIKNPSSKAAQAARQLNARQRLCLSGTPLENHLGELWSLLHFLMPGWLGDSKSFNRNYRTPIEKHGDTERLAHLNARIKPFLLRRRKDQVASELPPKNEIVHWVELSEAQRDLYETVRLAMDQKVREEIQRKGLARSQIVILEALLKLRQVCCDLRLAKGSTANRKSGSHSGKLDSLLEMLDELRAEGRRILLFSQFTSMLALIETELQKRDMPYALLTGSTTDRRTPVQQFQNGEVPLFLISLKAGGTGLNLTAADTVIHYDPWWNPAAEQQATDRAYRIGQDKPVFVYKLIARGTVEEKIQQLQQRKAALAAGVLESGTQGDWQLQPGDIDALFAPLPASR